MTLQTNFFIPVQQFFDRTTHLPLEGGYVRSYISGTTTPKSLYSSYYGATKLPNPCRLGSDGLIDGGMWGNGSYKIVIKDSTDTVTIATYDNVSDISVDTFAYFVFTDNTVTVNTGADIKLQTASTGTYQLLGTASSAATLKLNMLGGVSFVSLVAPTAITSDRVLQLPDTDISKFSTQYTNTTHLTYTSLSALQDTGDNIPTTSNTAEAFSRTITPKNALNILKFKVTVSMALTSAENVVVALFKDAEVSAKAAILVNIDGLDRPKAIALNHTEVAGSSALSTYYVRIGTTSAGKLNGDSSTRLLGGVQNCTLTIEELTV